MVENRLFSLHELFCNAYAYTKTFKVFSLNPTFQGTQPLHSETAKLLASWVYTGIIFVTINMQTGND